MEEILHQLIDNRWVIAGVLPSTVTLLKIEMDTNHDRLEKDTSLFNFGYIVEFVTIYHKYSERTKKHKMSQWSMRLVYLPTFSGIENMVSVGKPYMDLMDYNSLNLNVSGILAGSLPDHFKSSPIWGNSPKAAGWNLPTQRLQAMIPWVVPPTQDSSHTSKFIGIPY